MIILQVKEVHKVQPLQLLNKDYYNSNNNKINNKSNNPKYKILEHHNNKIIKRAYSYKIINNNKLKTKLWKRNKKFRRLYNLNRMLWLWDHPNKQKIKIQEDKINMRMLVIKETGITKYLKIRRKKALDRSIASPEVLKMKTI